MAETSLRVELNQTQVPQEAETELSFRIVDADGNAVTDYEIEHEREMHLIVVRRDLTGFQHLHPDMAEDGTWSTPITLSEGGSYRIFADFSHAGESLTLSADLTVEGQGNDRKLPPEASESETRSGYKVRVEGATAQAGHPTELAFGITRDGEQVAVEPYLGANGHLVALREADLEFLHVHPMDGEAHDHTTGHESRAGDDHVSQVAASSEEVRFMTEFPSAGRYRLFLQFKHDGDVHTAEFTRDVRQ